MYKSQINPMPVYFDRYINLADDVHLNDALQISLNELEAAPTDTWKALGDMVYAPGKWTLKDMLQHIIDTDRVFTYRALAAARGDQQKMLPFEEDDYAANAEANRRDLDEIIEELKLQRRSIIAMFRSFPEATLNNICKGYNSEYSVAAIAFTIAGHQRWHFNILKERYYPLV